MANNNNNNNNNNHNNINNSAANGGRGDNFPGGATTGSASGFHVAGPRSNLHAAVMGSQSQRPDAPLSSIPNSALSGSPMSMTDSPTSGARPRRGRSISKRFMQLKDGENPAIGPSQIAHAATPMNVASPLHGHHHEHLNNPKAAKGPVSPLTQPTGRWWIILSRVLTFWAPSPILRRANSFFHDDNIIQAWREKVALCIIFATIGIALAFLTLGLNKVLCAGSSSTPKYTVESGVPDGHVRIFGSVYKFGGDQGMKKIHGGAFDSYVAAIENNKRDASLMFFKNPQACPARFLRESCSMPGGVSGYCHDYNSPAVAALRVGDILYPWEKIKESAGSSSSYIVVFNGKVLDLAPYFANSALSFGPEIDSSLKSAIGYDLTLRASSSKELYSVLECLQYIYAAGGVDEETPGCIASKIILYISLIIILSVVLTRFIMAVLFDWFLSWKLGKLIASRDQYQKSMTLPRQQKTPGAKRDKNMHTILASEIGSAAATGGDVSQGPVNEGAILASKRHVAASYFGPQGTVKQSLKNSPGVSYNDSVTALNASEANLSQPNQTRSQGLDYNEDMLRQYYTVVLVTCYSEGDDSMRATLDSIANCTYSDEHKLLFIVADGIITGSDNAKSTPEIVLDMIEEVDLGPVEPQSYIAIADGQKRHNMAKVHVGWYRCGEHAVPTVVVIKIGAESERKGSKPGNRGKRDGQIILMDFFSKLMFGDRLSPLQYELYRRIKALTRVDPIEYEICLMVDADTKLRPESLARLVAACAQDPMIMGLCGETRIENKGQTWVTSIQVFEYYISHHLGKAFESIFGGVTCLPGCFCMYRLKVRRRSDGNVVPILCSPGIIQQYSENIVDTLHKKNLLSLGEDRFLSSLMLRAFPKRKMMFVPKALCRTVVPHTLRMLMSQRRRWINSTIHNLFELALVRELCGTFCFSMQFVVVLELIGTITLPVAIALTLTLLFVTIAGDIQLIPLLLLLAILGLPAILILLTTRKLVYIYWMLIYLVALPVWNFLLPVYAFWHFDDFSWGETRKVAGEDKQHDHSQKEGEFDGSLIPLRYKYEWKQVRGQEKTYTGKKPSGVANQDPAGSQTGASTDNLNSQTGRHAPAPVQPGTSTAQGAKKAAKEEGPLRQADLEKSNSNLAQQK